MRRPAVDERARESVGEANPGSLLEEDGIGFEDVMAKGGGKRKPASPRRQLELAKELGLPLFLHERDAATAFLEVLDAVQPEPAQVVQVLALVPTLAPLPWQVSHDSHEGMRICASLPRAASSSVTSIA